MNELTPDEIADHAARYKRIENRFESEDFADLISLAVELYEDPDRDFDAKDFILSFTHSMPALLSLHGYQWATGDFTNMPEGEN